MKKLILSVLMGMIIPLMSFVQVYAREFLPFGQYSQTPWTASFYFAKSGEDAPADNWYAKDFDESNWDTLEGPISTQEGGLSYYRTVWSAEYGTYWVRRHFTVDNLNGEVMAQNVFGPFRIEGNYLKSSEPQGFAITIGKLEDSMATTLNAVFTHPKSNSYVRFDGSFQLSNRVLNGNVVVESQKLSDFVNDNTDKIKLDNVINIIASHIFFDIFSFY